MADSSLHSTQLHRCLTRLRAGDQAAADELLRSVCDRLERLARKMLRAFPNVRRWADTDDVLQNAVVRLLRTLQQLQPASMRDFYGLAAEHIRRELLDLARHFGGPHGLGANHASLPPGEGAAPAPEGVAPTDEPGELEQWQRFHEAILRLPAEEREVVSLLYYHGWSTVQVAELLQINERTIRRRWRSGCLRLEKLLHGRLPGLGSND
jgi:RNA polymerase sigma factor (sigma-70 family)